MTFLPVNALASSIHMILLLFNYTSDTEPTFKAGSLRIESCHVLFTVLECMALHCLKVHVGIIQTQDLLQVFKIEV